MTFARHYRSRRRSISSSSSSSNSVEDVATRCLVAGLRRPFVRCYTTQESDDIYELATNDYPTTTTTTTTSAGTSSGLGYAHTDDVNGCIIRHLALHGEPTRLHTHTHTHTHTQTADLVYANWPSYERHCLLLTPTTLQALNIVELSVYEKMLKYEHWLDFLQND